MFFAGVIGGHSEVKGVRPPPPAYTETVTLVVPALAVTEGDTDPSDVLASVHRAGSMALSFTVAWAVTGVGGTPAVAADFQGGVLPSGTLQFGPSDQALAIDGIRVAANDTAQATRRFAITLSLPVGTPAGVIIDAGRQEIDILDDDGGSTTARLDVSTSTPTITEGDVGDQTTVDIKVRRTVSTAGSSSAQWVIEGTGSQPATEGDFVGGDFPAGTVAFAAGETVKSLPVKVSGNNVDEPPRTFRARIYSPSGAVIGTPTADVTIIDDDAGGGGDELPTPKRIIHVPGDMEFLAARSAAKAGTHVYLGDGKHEYYDIVDGKKVAVEWTASGTQSDPIVIRATNKLKAAFDTPLVIRGQDVWLWGVSRTKKTLEVRGSRCRVLRCKLVIRNGYGVRIYASYCKVLGNDISATWVDTDITRDGLLVYGVQAPAPQTARFGEVAYNHFHDFPTDPDAYGGVSIRSNCISIGDGAIDGLADGQWNIHHNLLYGSIGNGDINLKVSNSRACDNTLIGDFARLDARFGNGNIIERNWVQDCRGTEVMGSGHRLAFNKFVGTRLKIFFGDQSWDMEEYPDHWPNCANSAFIGNEGAVTLGYGYKDQQIKFPATNNTFRGHLPNNDAIDRRPYEGDPPNRKYREKDNHFYTDLGEPRQYPKKLTASQVGPSGSLKW